MSPPDRLPADLVLEGGGVKGIALVGAAVELLRRYRFERVAGSSAGAVLAAFLATGLDADGVLERTFRLEYDYGLDPDAQPVADAVRASLAIPFFFAPRKLRDPYTGRRSTLLDGGVLSNFPVEIFDRTDAAPPRWPTFGVGVSDVLSDEEVSVFPHRRLLPPPVRLLDSLVATTVNGRDRTYLAQPCVRRRAISIDTSGTRATDFDIGAVERARLLASGTAAAQAFLAGWSWEDYLRECRSVRTG